MDENHLTVNTARAASERYIESIPPYPERYAGRGIVTCAGGKYFTSAWISINVLRQLGCTLPIQLWYLGPNELDASMKRLLEPLGVECVDTVEVCLQHPARIMGGWESKAYAVLHSKFREILFLDADNLPAVNPEYLFETAAYKEIGAIFWPDRGRFSAEHPIWDICGVSYRSEPEFESGQMIVDKERCWQALNLSMWYNEHSDFYYNIIHGDKDTFHMAFRKTAKEYAMPAKGMDDVNDVFYQYDFDGDLVFQHRVKWDYFKTTSSYGSLHSGVCWSFLESLRAQWDGLVHSLPHYTASDATQKHQRIAEELTRTVFVYELCGGESRLMVFSPDGTVGLGSKEREVFWNLTEERGAICLDIYSANALTCHLEQKPSGEWEGHWIDGNYCWAKLVPTLQELCSFNSFKLRHFLPTSGQREALLIALNYLMGLNLKIPICVEIGGIQDAQIEAQRTDGWSTLCFGWYADVIGAEFHSVDISDFHMSVCRRVTQTYSNVISYHVEDGKGFLEAFERPISLLYLDAWSEESSDEIGGYLPAYLSLAEPPLMLILNRIPEDCNYTLGLRRLVVQLLTDGYMILYHIGSQLCFVRPIHTVTRGRKMPLSQGRKGSKH